MPFYQTTVTVRRFAMTTPMGVTKVVVTAETEAPNAPSARALAITATLDMLRLDNVSDVTSEAM
jgi:hypothetical protein